jgi:DNA polymerase-3 subunit delta
VIVKPAEAERFAAAPPASARLILVYGPDNAGVADLGARIAAKLGGERVEFDARVLKAEPGRLADAAAAVSMFGDRQLLRVSGADDGATEAAALLLASADGGHPALMLAGDLKKTSPLRKLAESHPAAHVLACYPPDARAFAGLVREQAKALGLDADAAAVALIAAANAPERGLLAQELEKLALYLDAAPERPQRLDPDAVRAVGAGEGAAEVDALVDALSARDGKRAASALARLEAEGEAGIMLIRYAQRRLAQLAEARAAVDQGQTPEAAADAIRPPLFWKAKPGFVAALKRWRTTEVAAARSALLAAERAIKAPQSAGERLAAEALLTLATPRR